MFNSNRVTIAHGVIDVWERMPYISDIGLVRNFSKAGDPPPPIHFVFLLT